MQEDLLQYIWRFQHYNRCQLITTDGEVLSILYPGEINTHQGPDFLYARIKIGDTLFAGNIELHVESSHWNQHKHGEDARYQNVILHVVWRHNASIEDHYGMPIPTLELHERVSKILLEKYVEMMKSPVFIPCENQLPSLNSLQTINWLERLSTERLIEKSKKILGLLERTGNHWEETFWQAIATNFGTKVNSEEFGKMAQTLPLTLIAKHKNSVLQMESLLFGQAGLLESEFTDAYPLQLQREYHFYQKKYQLTKVDGACSFLRMTPASFPTIRLSQLAALLYKSHHLFSKILEIKDLNDLEALFDITASDYWDTHYVFDSPTKKMEKRLGKQMINNILINTVIPIVFAYGYYHQNETLQDKATEWLQNISSEKNTILTQFEKLGFSNSNALESQALIHQKKQYCEKIRCLECGIGHLILRRD